MLATPFHTHTRWPRGDTRDSLLASGLQSPGVGGEALQAKATQRQVSTSNSVTKPFLEAGRAQGPSVMSE